MRPTVTWTSTAATEVGSSSYIFSLKGGTIEDFPTVCTWDEKTE